MSWASTALAVAFAVSLPLRYTNAAAPPALETYESLADADVTVSGVSSGAFFAHQFAVAYSALVSGVGLVAGGPYACAEQAPWFVSVVPLPPFRAAIAACTRAGMLGWLSHVLAGAPDPQSSAGSTWRKFEEGAIDEPTNLRRHRVWIFSGALDATIPPATTAALRDYYELMGVPPVNIAFEERPDAGHGLPVEEFRGKSDYPKRKCDDGEPPFIIDCDRDAAELMFRHFYQDAFRGFVTPRREHLASFDQREFFPAVEPDISMAEAGHVYVPARCANGRVPKGACHLHVAFHACLQSEEFVGDDFYWDGGYNRWAEANDIIILYPQTAPRFGGAAGGDGSKVNPSGCWDWWGYTGDGYDTKAGKQMRAIRMMVERMRGH